MCIKKKFFACGEQLLMKIILNDIKFDLFELFKSIHHVHSNIHVLKEEICLALKISKFY